MKRVTTTDVPSYSNTSVFRLFYVLMSYIKHKHEGIVKHQNIPMLRNVNVVGFSPRYDSDTHATICFSKSQRNHKQSIFTTLQQKLELTSIVYPRRQVCRNETLNICNNYHFISLFKICTTISHIRFSPARYTFSRLPVNPPRALFRSSLLYFIRAAFKGKTLQPPFYNNNVLETLSGIDNL